jgi:tetratricopeptide (TPR) repeat protein
MSELEYKINEFIKLKLEDDKTFIYIEDEKFLNCIRLMLQIPIDDTEDFEEINSIDEAASVHKTLYQNTVYEDYQPHTITPEQEFWGHCSNLQVWFEHEYDSRLIHSNIAFPLLKRLSKAGDPLARRVLKHEVAERFTAGYLPVTIYLINENYLHIFNKEELKVLVKYLIGEINKLNEDFLERQSKAELNDIGRALNEIGQYNKAKEILSKAMEKDPYYSIALNNIGISYYNEKNYERAKENYSKAAENDPNDALAWSNLSEIYDIEGDFEKSMELSEKALFLSPNNYEALFFYAHANYKKDYYDRAIKYYKKALDIEDDDKLSFTLKDHRIWAQLGEAYFKKGNYKEALRACEESIDLKPHYLHAMNLKKRIKKKQKR